MKNIKKFAFLAFAAVIIAACAPQEFDDYNLETPYKMTQEQFTFDFTQGSDQWTYSYNSTFTVDPVKYPFTAEIHFGNGVDVALTPRGNSLSGTYVYKNKGTYTVQCRVYTPNGDVHIKEKVVTITEDRP